MIISVCKAALNKDHISNYNGDKLVAIRDDFNGDLNSVTMNYDYKYSR